MASLSLVAPAPDRLWASLKQVNLDVVAPAGMLAIAAAAIYFLSDARSRLSISFSWSTIQENIHARLIDAVAPLRTLTLEEKTFLTAKRRLLDIFYKIIDNDESLKSRQLGVRFNGVLVTSVTDVGIVSIGFAICHLAVGLFLGQAAHVGWFIVLSFCWLISEIFLIPAALRRHKGLSDEQLDVIENHHRTELLNLVEGALRQLHPPAQSQSGARYQSNSDRVS